MGTKDCAVEAPTPLRRSQRQAAGAAYLTSGDARIEGASVAAPDVDELAAALASTESGTEALAVLEDVEAAIEIVQRDRFTCPGSVLAELPVQLARFFVRPRASPSAGETESAGQRSPASPTLASHSCSGGSSNGGEAVLQIDCASCAVRTLALLGCRAAASRKGVLTAVTVHLKNVVAMMFEGGDALTAQCCALVSIVVSGTDSGFSVAHSLLSGEQSGFAASARRWLQVGSAAGAGAVSCVVALLRTLLSTVPPPARSDWEVVEGLAVEVAHYLSKVGDVPDDRGGTTLQKVRDALPEGLHPFLDFWCESSLRSNLNLLCGTLLLVGEDARVGAELASVIASISVRHTVEPSAPLSERVTREFMEACGASQQPSPGRSRYVDTSQPLLQGDVARLHGSIRAVQRARLDQEGLLVALQSVEDILCGDVGPRARRSLGRSDQPKRAAAMMLSLVPGGLRTLHGLLASVDEMVSMKACAILCVVLEGAKHNSGRNPIGRIASQYGLRVARQFVFAGGCVLLADMLEDYVPAVLIGAAHLLCILYAAGKEELAVVQSTHQGWVIPACLASMCISKIERNVLPVMLDADERLGDGHATVRSDRPTSQPAPRPATAPPECGLRWSVEVIQLLDANVAREQLTEEVVKCLSRFEVQNRRRAPWKAELANRGLAFLASVFPVAVAATLELELVSQLLHGKGDGAYSPDTAAWLVADKMWKMAMIVPHAPSVVTLEWMELLFVAIGCWCAREASSCVVAHVAAQTAIWRATAAVLANVTDAVGFFADNDQFGELANLVLTAAVEQELCESTGGGEERVKSRRCARPPWLSSSPNCGEDDGEMLVWMIRSLSWLPTLARTESIAKLASGHPSKGCRMACIEYFRAALAAAQQAAPSEALPPLDAVSPSLCTATLTNVLFSLIFCAEDDNDEDDDDDDDDGEDSSAWEETNVEYLAPCDSNAAVATDLRATRTKVAKITSQDVAQAAFGALVDGGESVVSDLSHMALSTLRVFLHLATGEAAQMPVEEMRAPLDPELVGDDARDEAHDVLVAIVPLLNGVVFHQSGLLTIAVRRLVVRVAADLIATIDRVEELQLHFTSYTVALYLMLNSLRGDDDRLLKLLADDLSHDGRCISRLALILEYAAAQPSQRANETDGTRWGLDEDLQLLAGAVYSLAERVTLLRKLSGKAMAQDTHLMTLLVGHALRDIRVNEAASLVLLTCQADPVREVLRTRFPGEYTTALQLLKRSAAAASTGLADSVTQRAPYSQMIVDKYLAEVV